MEMPERGPGPYDRGTEPPMEPRPGERMGPRGSRLEPVERERYVQDTRMVGLRPMLQWGPVWAGLVGAFGLLLVLGLLGLAVGLGTARNATTGQLGTASLIWGVIITLVSFFVGGWIAGRTASYPSSSFAGFIIGSIVWALGTALAVLLTAMGVGGVVGTALSIFGVPSTTGVTPAPGTLNAAQTAAVGTLIGLVLAYIASVLGGIAGMNAADRNHQVPLQ